MREGLRLLKDKDYDVVLVLGDPAYYSRHGFNPEPQLQPPYALPAEWYSAWQSQYFDAANLVAEGKLAVPSQWREPTLWAP